jgi:hypothetical protein
MKRSPKPGDASQVAWAVVQEAIGQSTSAQPREKDPAAVERGRKGGLTRAKTLTPERRREIAMTGVAAKRRETV